MAREKAGMWIMGIIAYFLIISVVLTGLNKMTSEYSTTPEGLTYTTGGLGKSLNNLGGCDDPRLVNENNPECKLLMDIGSVYNNATCDSFNGCEWVTESSFFPWGESTVTCSGTINQTAYNNGENYTTFNLFGNWGDSVCGLYNLSQDKSTCQAFGCTWTSQNSDDYIKVSKIAGIWGIIKDVFTANINFGTSSTSLNTLLNFIFIVLPIVMLIMAIIMFVLG